MKPKAWAHLCTAAPAAGTSSEPMKSPNPSEPQVDEAAPAPTLPLLAAGDSDARKGEPGPRCAGKGDPCRAPAWKGDAMRPPALWEARRAAQSGGGGSSCTAGIAPACSRIQRPRDAPAAAAVVPIKHGQLPGLGWGLGFRPRTRRPHHCIGLGRPGLGITTGDSSYRPYTCLTKATAL